ncbi:hypothetical protein TH606_08420 [Thermodesulfatator autotrophicus]|uniref:Radical SAM core domain-containing protein n=1 Tax=Thermodesulfatator autotrophicus TaxID=1795632 RepID=A0A177E5V6_9BACT|nr:hypothetical protein TH606_08420 [Thermodesulfatator autotrophicus]
MGVDPLIPKVCSFDCLYCEIGPTKIHTLYRQIYRSTEEIKKALKERLSDKTLHFEVLTFAGSGEPTLHAELDKLILFAKELTDRPICVLTNSSLLWQEEVRKALVSADLVLPSLDAVSEDVFQKLNRPVEGLKSSKIIEGLKKFREEFTGEIWLEIMFVAGINDSETEIKALAKVTKEISPDKIQLNSVDRPPAYARAKAIPLKKMREIASFFEGQVEVITREALKEAGGKRKPSAQEILALISHRPAPSKEIAQALSSDFRATLTILEELVKKGQAKTKRHQNKIFYYV